MALCTLELRDPDDDGRPWKPGLGYSDPKRVAAWEALAAESRRQQVHLGMVEGEICRCQECEESRGVTLAPTSVAPPPEPVKPKPRKRKPKRTELTPKQCRALGWEDMKLRRNTD